MLPKREAMVLVATRRQHSGRPLKNTACPGRVVSWGESPAALIICYAAVIRQCSEEKSEEMNTLKNPHNRMMKDRVELLSLPNKD